jgi:catechol 2,3-dioxygenase-like lactoylglutathione lyase family enzyme
MLLLAGCLALVGCADSVTRGLARPSKSEVPVVPPVNYTAKAFAYVVISVADMDQALGLWVSRFGMQIVVRRQGSDPGLAKLWGLAEGDIIDQALLVTPGREQGGVHLVRFRVPGAPVRDGAAPTDLVPKSVDIAVHDISTRYAELEAAGYQFRSKIGRFETDGIVVHEVHMNGPESVNLVFLEQEGKPEHVSSLGYGVAPQVIATTPDNLGEKAFFEKVLGLDETSYHRFSGPEVERTIGLPPGGGLDVRIFGDAAYDYGRLEIVQYEGVQSKDLYPRAVPPARGLLSVTFFVPSIDTVLARAAALLQERGSAAMRSAPRDHGITETLFGRARMVTLTSPAGLVVQLVERP